jgi:hypothetical protein
VEEARRITITELAPKLGTPETPGGRAVFTPGAALEVEAALTNTGRLRWWWKCPACDRRRAALYLAPNGALRCRVCLPLAYWVQRCAPADRLANRMQKIARRLGDAHPANVPRLPDKPLGMHWATYERHATAFRAAEERRNAHFIGATLRFFGRTDAFLARMAAPTPTGRRALRAASRRLKNNQINQGRER